MIGGTFLETLEPLVNDRGENTPLSNFFTLREAMPMK